MREYMQVRRRAVMAHCACGSKAWKICNGNEGICARCWEIEQRKEVLCKRQYGAKWQEDEPETPAARFWRRKLDTWLPNPTPGWGSLEILERRLSV
jgi:hypothetical protein